MSRNKNIGWTKAWVRVGQKSTSTLQVTSIPIPWQQSNPQTHTAEFAQNWALWLVCWSYCVNILLVARSQPVILRLADPLLCIAQFQVICQLFAGSLVSPVSTSRHTVLELWSIPGLVTGQWPGGGGGTKHEICFKQKMCSTRGGDLLCRQQVLKWHTAISVAVASKRYLLSALYWSGESSF